MKQNAFYSTKCKGIGGQIKRLYTDFVVEEIIENRECKAIAFLKNGFYEEQLSVPEKTSEFLHLDLEKINKDLHSVIRELARFLHVSKKRIGYAGLKDKRAVTCQRISIWNPETKLVEKFHAKGVRLRNPEWSDKKIDLGMLKGNRFTITIRDIGLKEKEIEKRVKECFKEMKKGIANFFGEQRFGGIRTISHLVGREIIKRNFENAIMLYLTATAPEEEIEVKKARTNLANTRNYSAALKEFPLKYRYERAILNSLCSNSNDFVKAFRALPLRLRFLFTHAYQSFLFNELLKRRIEKGIGLKPIAGEPQSNGIALGLLPGFNSSFSPGEIGGLERDLMEEEGISFADFKVPELKECSSKGARRKILLFPKKMKLVQIGNDKLFEKKHFCTVSFELDKGGYATVVLNELSKNPNINLLN